MNKNNLIVIAAIAAIAAGLVAWNAYRAFYGGRPKVLTAATATAPILPSQTITVGGPTEIPQYRGAAIDALSTDEILKLLTPEQKERYLGELAELAARLRTNPADLELWLHAGSLKNFFNDYRGAADIWEHVTRLAPDDATAYLNLGTLFAWNLADYPAAERNFKKAIALSPSYAQGYLKLAEFYRLFVPEKKNEALTVLLRGLEKAPRDLGLLLALANDYKSAGDDANALRYYEEYAAIDPNNKDANAIIAELRERLSQ